MHGSSTECNTIVSERCLRNRHRKHKLPIGELRYCICVVEGAETSRPGASEQIVLWAPFALYRFNWSCEPQAHSCSKSHSSISVSSRPRSFLAAECAAVLWRRCTDVSAGDNLPPIGEGRCTGGCVSSNVPESLRTSTFLLRAGTSGSRIHLSQTVINMGLDLWQNFYEDYQQREWTRILYMVSNPTMSQSIRPFEARSFGDIGDSLLLSSGR